MRTSVIHDPSSGSAETVSVLGLGCSRVGSLGNPAPNSQVLATLAGALDLGITLFDTADIYGQGDSERMLGRALGKRRSEAFIVTKFGNLFSRKMRLIRPFKPLIKPLLGAAKVRNALSGQREGNLSKDFAVERLRPAVDASLRRLGVTEIDALLLHSPVAAVVRDPRLQEGLAQLRKDGKVRHFGVAVDDLEALDAAADLPGASVVQVTLEVLDAAIASGVAKRLQERRIAVLAREVIRSHPNLTPDAAVRAAVSRKDVTAVIAGTTNPRHLEGLVQACA